MDKKFKVKVVSPFINKYTKNVVNEGEVLEISKKRIKEIQEVSGKFLQLLEDIDLEDDKNESNIVIEE